MLFLQQARRVAALSDLHKMLRDADTDAVSTVQGLLPSLWPQILGLLGDSSADVRQMAAPVVGLLGSIATRQGARSGKHVHCITCSLHAFNLETHSVAIATLGHKSSSNMMGLWFVLLPV